MDLTWLDAFFVLGAVFLRNCEPCIFKLFSVVFGKHCEHDAVSFARCSLVSFCTRSFVSRNHSMASCKKHGSNAPRVARRFSTETQGRREVNDENP